MSCDEERTKQSFEPAEVLESGEVTGKGARDSRRRERPVSGNWEKGARCEGASAP